MNNKLLKFINKIIMGNKNKKEFIFVPYNEISLKFTNILHKEGFINFYEIIANKKIMIFFKYEDDISMIHHIKMISKPSRYINYKYKSIFSKNIFSSSNFIEKLQLEKIKKKNFKKLIKHININNFSHIKFLKTLYKLKKKKINFYKIIKNKIEKKFSISYNRKVKKIINKKLIKNDEKKTIIPFKYNINNLKYISKKIFFKNKRKKIKVLPEKIYYNNKRLLRTSEKTSYFNNAFKKYSYLSSMGGLMILSTTAGLMTHKEAYKHKIGGTLICEIY